ncbi:tyrosine-type recombinase/integrase [Streptomyces griseus]|uniref:tyrosine-type recombinase/integrase n=1 Tax=Streptomyces griseus TaxID=1911 RepID=UPI000B0D5677
MEMSLARLKEALNRAVARRLVAANVAQEVTIPRKVRMAERRVKAVVQPWNVEEVHAFVRAVNDDRLYAPLLLSLMGLRPAEICGMRWADVDLGKAALSVANTRTLMGNKTVVEKDTKSLAAERQLPLPDPVREELTCFRAMQVAEKLAAGERYEESGYVLVDELGKALNGRQLREWVYKVMDENGLRAGQRLHPCPCTECEMWERGWVSEKNVETLQYRFDGPEQAPVLVMGCSLGATWHRL